MDVVLLICFVINLLVFRKTLFRLLCKLFRLCCHITWSYLRSKSDVKERRNIDTLDNGGKENSKFEFECKEDPKIEIVERKEDFKTEIVERKGNRDILVEEDREDIKIQNEGILYEIKRILNKLEQLEKNKKLVLENEESIARNENFTYTVEREETKPVSFYVEPNTSTVTCQTCHTLCHRSCTILTNYGLYRCVAMDNQGDSAHAKCLKCPNHCSWKRHVTTRYVVRSELETSETSFRTSYRSSADLLREFRGSDGKLMQVSVIIKLMDEECEANTLLIIGLVQVLRQNLTLLDGTAPTVTGYIDILINSESSSDENGWEQRVEKLYRVKKMVNGLVEEAKRGRSPVELFKNKVKRRNNKIWSDVEHFLKIMAF